MKIHGEQKCPKLRKIRCRRVSGTDSTAWHSYSAKITQRGFLHSGAQCTLGRPDFLANSPATFFLESLGYVHMCGPEEYLAQGGHFPSWF